MTTVFLLDNFAGSGALTAHAPDTGAGVWLTPVNSGSGDWTDYNRGGAPRI